jgi:hypothetical protein
LFIDVVKEATEFVFDPRVVRSIGTDHQTPEALVRVLEQIEEDPAHLGVAAHEQEEQGLSPRRFWLLRIAGDHSQQVGGKVP